MRLDERAICGKSLPSNLSSLSLFSIFSFFSLSLRLAALSLSPFSLSLFRAHALRTVCTGFSPPPTLPRYLSIYLSTCLSLALYLFCVYKIYAVRYFHPVSRFCVSFSFLLSSLCRIILLAYVCVCVFVTRVSNRVANVVEARANGPAHVNDEPAFMRRLGVQKLDCATSRSHTVSLSPVLLLLPLYKAA